MPSFAKGDRFTRHNATSKTGETFSNSNPHALNPSKTWISYHEKVSQVPYNNVEECLRFQHPSSIPRRQRPPQSLTSNIPSLKHLVEAPSVPTIQHQTNRAPQSPTSYIPSFKVLQTPNSRHLLSQGSLKPQLLHPRFQGPLRPQHPPSPLPRTPQTPTSYIHASKAPSDPNILNSRFQGPIRPQHPTFTLPRPSQTPTSTSQKIEGPLRL